jgi:hypothetical protein
MPRDPLVVHEFLPLDERLTLPKRFCERLSWITGKDVEAWLYLLEPGRFRLLSDEDVKSDPRLAPVRLLILQEETITPVHPSHAKPLEAAAIVAQLIPITIDNHKGSWRISLSEELGALAPRDTNPRALSILMPEGYLEIWYSDTLRKSAGFSMAQPAIGTPRCKHLYIMPSE